MKLKISPNGLTCQATTGNLVLEVWGHGGVTRIVRDSSVCGFRGTHYSRVPTPRQAGTKLTADQFGEMARAAVASWKAGGWNECE